MKVRALIVDDEPLAREKIRTFLADDPDVEVIGECTDGRDAVATIRKLTPDLIFLDVQMPELGGFDVLDLLGNGPMPAVIFVTAYDQYALRAFEVHALDYLLKPFNRDRFHKALQRAKVQIAGAGTGDLRRRLLALLEGRQPPPKYQERFVIKTAGRVFFLRSDELDWIEAAANYVRLHVGKEAHLLRETMSSLEAKLDPDKFLRIHRSAIVNLGRIKELQPWFRGEYVVILHDGTRLISSRGYREKLRELLH